MHTRRDFLKRAALISGAAAFSGAVTESVQRAFAIEPAPGSTYMDAAHVVILMQENRSFDHALGTLQGVRGFNDPRAVTLSNGNLVWFQADDTGDTYAPFRLDIKDTQATWMGALPHSRESQVDAWNMGNYDQWLNAKRARRPEYGAIPLTMGHYTREDLPFYYALADAFTVCDQNFSGVMTSTTPNRMMFWTGTIREQQSAASKANLRNSDYTNAGAHWTTFPEQLQRNNISWKFYQNELSIISMDGMSNDQDAWLSNFGCNPFEQFANYNVQFSNRYLASLPTQIVNLTAAIERLEANAAAANSNPRGAARIKSQLAERKTALEVCKEDLQRNHGALERLSKYEQELHERAFSTNESDPDHGELLDISYMDGPTKRTVTLPKGDILHQFREDVQNGKLPTVSWLASPEKFSDHPSQPWFGAWYVSEVMDILTSNPEVWKKTVFILTYDENDGYFDHIPPFVSPDPRRKDTGKLSPSLANEVEYAYLEDELAQGVPQAEARTGPVGLGFRVPMIIASPWSRGGWVNSQLFDHSSTNRFLETFLNAKFGTSLKETNLSPWRRSISGDLTSAFRPFDGDKPPSLPFIQRDPYVETIYNAKFKAAPSNFHKLDASEIATLSGPASAMRQEKGIRPSSAIPTQCYVEGALDVATQTFAIEFRAERSIFGERATGAPFNVYARWTKEPLGGAKIENSSRGYMRNTACAVAVGESLRETWLLDSFVDGKYGLSVHSANGFLREFAGDKSDPALAVHCDCEADSSDPTKLTGNLLLHFTNSHNAPYTVDVIDHAYGADPVTKVINPVDPPRAAMGVKFNLARSFGWYDFVITVRGFDQFRRRCAGHVNTGRASYTDPFMGRVASRQRV